MGRLTGCRGSPLPTLPHPVTAVWAWGGGAAGGAVTTVTADLRFTVGVVVAMHHTHTHIRIHTAYTHHTHTDTHPICVSGVPRTAVPMEQPDFDYKLYLPQIFPEKNQLHK